MQRRLSAPSIKRAAVAAWTAAAVALALLATSRSADAQGEVAQSDAQSAGAAADAPHPAVLDAETKRIELVAKVSAATVAIFSPGGEGGGSGVVITPDGYALTNFHVAKPCGDWLRCGMADGRLYDAVIVGIDPVGDVALVKLLGRDDFPAAPLGDSDAVRVGDFVLAAGNPFLLATDLVPTVTFGIVSGVRRYQYPAGTLLEYADCIQTDASINPGNSGGPLFNLRGEVIGINGRISIEKRGRVNVGVGYAISINQIKNFLGHLRAGRIVDHATLGAVVASDDAGRVHVTDVLETSDAHRRGLRYDDELEYFGNRPIHTVNAMKNALGIYPKGWRVPLVFRRGTARFETFVRLEALHREAELIAKASAGPPEAEPPDPQPEPKPQPKSEPKPGDPPPDGDGPRGHRKDRPRMPLPGMPAPAEQMPPHVRQHYQPRYGFANYHFNRLERDRVWQRHASGGDFSALAGEWTARGRQLAAANEPAGSIELVLAERRGVCDVPAGRVQVTFTAELDRHREPAGSGGLLVALHLWQRLLVAGPDRFGRVDYRGTLPLPGETGLFDALVGTHGGVEAHFLFDPAHGRLAAIEMFADDESDPCEVRLADYRDVGGRMLPHRMEVRHGDRMFGVFQIDQWELAKQ